MFFDLTNYLKDHFLYHLIVIHFLLKYHSIYTGFNTDLNMNFGKEWTSIYKNLWIVHTYQFRNHNNHEFWKSSLTRTYFFFDYFWGTDTTISRFFFIYILFLCSLSKNFFLFLSSVLLHSRGPKLQVKNNSPVSK